MLQAVYLAPFVAEALARDEARQLDGAPFLGLLMADCEGEHGAALLRVRLEATAHGLALQPISVLLDRRGWELARHLGVTTGRLVFPARRARRDFATRAPPSGA